jgi:hypothetical protein
MTETIFEIKRFAVHEGDGIRTTVFFGGAVPFGACGATIPKGHPVRPKPPFTSINASNATNAKVARYHLSHAQIGFFNLIAWLIRSVVMCFCITLTTLFVCVK